MTNEKLQDHKLYEFSSLPATPKVCHISNMFIHPP